MAIPALINLFLPEDKVEALRIKLINCLQTRVPLVPPARQEKGVSKSRCLSVVQVLLAWHIRAVSPLSSFQVVDLCGFPKDLLIGNTADHDNVLVDGGAAGGDIAPVLNVRESRPSVNVWGS